MLVLSPPGDPLTHKLAAPIENDLKSEAGRPVAFTQNQRYISFERLATAKKTSDLVER